MPTRNKNVRKQPKNSFNWNQSPFSEDEDSESEQQLIRIRDLPEVGRMLEPSDTILQVPLDRRKQKSKEKFVELKTGDDGDDAGLQNRLMQPLDGGLTLKSRRLRHPGISVLQGEKEKKVDIGTVLSLSEPTSVLLQSRFNLSRIKQASVEDKSDPDLQQELEQEAEDNILQLHLKQLQAENQVREQASIALQEATARRQAAERLEAARIKQQHQLQEIEAQERAARLDITQQAHSINALLEQEHVALQEATARLRVEAAQAADWTNLEQRQQQHQLQGIEAQEKKGRLDITRQAHSGNALLEQEHVALQEATERHQFKAAEVVEWEDLLKTQTQTLDKIQIAEAQQKREQDAKSQLQSQLKSLEERFHQETTKITTLEETELTQLHSAFKKIATDEAQRQAAEHLAAEQTAQLTAMPTQSIEVTDQKVEAQVLQALQKSDQSNNPLVAAIQTNGELFASNSAHHTLLQLSLLNGNWEKAYALLGVIKSFNDDALLAAYINVPCRCSLKYTALHCAVQRAGQDGDLNTAYTFIENCKKLITGQELTSLHSKNSQEQTPLDMYYARANSKQLEEAVCNKLKLKGSSAYQLSDIIQSNLTQFDSTQHTLLQRYLFNGMWVEAYELLRVIKNFDDDALLAAYINVPCICVEQHTALHCAVERAGQDGNLNNAYNFIEDCKKLITEQKLSSLCSVNSHGLTPISCYNNLHDYLTQQAAMTRQQLQSILAADFKGARRRVQGNNNRP